MRCEVVIRTAQGVLIQRLVEVERSCDAVGVVMALPGVGDHLRDLRFSALNINVRPLVHGMYADVRKADPGERSAA